VAASEQINPVKMPTTDGEGGFHKYKTQEGFFQAVSATLVERFQSALIAPCHRGKFFEDVGYLADGPVARQILEGTYEYPQDLDPATRLLFEEDTATYTSPVSHSDCHLRDTRGFPIFLADSQGTHWILLQWTSFWTL
jgi:hypothetical protein